MSKAWRIYTMEYCCCFCCSVAQSCPTLGDRMDCGTPGLPVLHHLPELRLTSTESVMPSNPLILCCPLLLLPSIFPSIRVFSTLEYYTAIKKKESLPFAATWMDLESFRLSQVKKNTI